MHSSGSSSSETSSGNTDSGSPTPPKETNESSSTSSTPSENEKKEPQSQSGHDHSDVGGTKTVKSGAKPKFNTEPPKDVDEEDVKRHNEDVDQRRERAGDVGGEVGDKVGKGFWSGEF